MNSNTKTLFSYFSLILLLIFSIGLLSACRVNINEKKENWYSYSLPQGWSSKDGDKIYNEKSEYVGGLSVKTYPRKNEDGGLEFSHAKEQGEIISQEVLTEFNYLVYKVVLRQSSPDSNENTDQRVFEHYLFPVSEHNILIDIYFDSEKTAQADQLEVIKSVKLKLDTEKYQSYLAEIWASARQSRDGKLRYAIMSEDVREDFIKTLETVDGEVVWSIGTSSPWVVDYTIEKGENSAVIYYVYTDSTGAKYTTQENITFGMEGEKQVVTSTQSSDLQEVMDEVEREKNKES
ncbi:MAG: hypothetical protein PHF89_01955 [Eubacteriales bacterium]|jgi:hypothetical protein|nr:hypothetical protein [Eubacteriales bacterium]